MRERVAGDRGSTIPLILGVFLIAMLLVAGAVAAGDAFVKQRDLQSICDGAAAAAASSADLNGNRHDGELDGSALPLAQVQRAVNAYLLRDSSRGSVHIAAELSPDRQTVALSCVERTHIAFGWAFGKGGGVVQTATSAARAPLS